MSGITEKHIKGQYAGVDGKSEFGLFFIAILPPEPIQKEVTLIKEEVRDKFGSKHALKSPPHITLHMPFRWKLKKLDRLHTATNLMAKDLIPFNIELSAFGSFPPRVIFIDVVENQHLRALQNRIARLSRLHLGLDNADYKNRGFHPHMTIAFRDLKKSKFASAWSKFRSRSFHTTFSVEQLTLLMHRDNRWSVYKTFPFSRGGHSSIE